MIDVETKPCEGCGKDFFNIFGGRHVCMDCVRARHRSAFGRCQCGRKARPKETGSGKRYEPPKRLVCQRCLATIRMLS